MLQRLLNLLFPPRCFFCGQLTPEALGHCGCHLDTRPVAQCAFCEQNFHQCVCTQPLLSPFYYSGSVKKAVLRLKSRKDKNLSDFFAKEIVIGLVRDYKNTPFTAVVPVPTTDKTRKVRGFNQAELLAHSVGDLTGLPVQSHLLVRSKDSSVQHTLSYEERKRNADVSYSPHPDLTETLSGAVLLIDDIATSGATLAACGRGLKELGARQIISATCCATKRK